MSAQGQQLVSKHVFLVFSFVISRCIYFLFYVNLKFIKQNFISLGDEFCLFKLSLN